MHGKARGAIIYIMVLSCLHLCSLHCVHPWAFPRAFIAKGMPDRFDSLLVADANLRNSRMRMCFGVDLSSYAVRRGGVEVLRVRAPMYEENVSGVKKG
jgi:hypothetical protein